MSNAIEYANVPTQHRYNGQVFPQIVVNNDGCKTVEETVTFIQQNQAELEAQLAISGALLFRGFPLNSAETFDIFSAGFGYANFTYKESLSNAVRINFTTVIKRSASFLCSFVSVSLATALNVSNSTSCAYSL